jgi:hypothetical protein
METEGKERFIASDSPTPGGASPRRIGRGLVFKLAALALVLVSFSASGFLMCHWLCALPGDGDPESSKPTSRLFFGWPKDRKPSLALLLSGEVHGYLEPCGCSEPQYGGLERRYNFMQKFMQERGCPVVPIDLGDVAQESGLQTLIKYRYAMEGMNKIGYAGAGFGKNEMAMPLLKALSEFALNNPKPRIVATNLLNKEKEFPDMVSSWEVLTLKGAPKVGVAMVVAPSVAKDVKDTDVKFAAIDEVLPQTIQKMKDKGADLLVLLFQGDVAEALKCAKKFPQFSVVLSLTREEEPPGKPVTDENGNPGQAKPTTMVINVGHKGRYVGMVGVYKTDNADKPFDLYYELVPLGPEYKTPPGPDDGHPILTLYQAYAKEVKDKNFLAFYPKTNHPIQQAFEGATYVGSEKCKECHQQAYAIWKASPHARAYDSLVNATRPSLRQYDGECVLCHVTGFAYTGGFTDEQKTPHLENNGCENCHGPCSLHVKKPGNKKLYPLMNPFKTPANETEAERTARLNRMDMACMKCHDTDNDTHWTLDKWVKGKIVHKEQDK